MLLSTLLCCLKNIDSSGGDDDDDEDDDDVVDVVPFSREETDTFSTLLGLQVTWVMVAAALLLIIAASRKSSIDFLCSKLRCPRTSIG